MKEGKTVEVSTARGSRTRTYMPIRAIEVKPSQFHPDEEDQVEIRQVRIDHYPSRRPNSNLIQGLYALDEFGYESSGDYETELVVWVDVPKGKTLQDVEKLLIQFPEATIFRILGDKVEDVLSENQIFAIEDQSKDENGDLRFPYDLDDAMRGHVILRADKETGELSAISSKNEVLEDAVVLDDNGRCIEILDDSELQYHSRGFSLEMKKDIDFRKEVGTPAQEPASKEVLTPAGETDEAGTTAK